MDYDKEFERLILSNAVVATGMQMVRRGNLAELQALKMIVCELAKQNKNLVSMVVFQPERITVIAGPS